MIGTLWKAKKTGIKYEIGDILIATEYFRCTSSLKMYIRFKNPQGKTYTCREEWADSRLDRIA
jgi:hypothetical protein